MRRLALLCGVFVRLQLALFPAGGPFLPSLSVSDIQLGQQDNSHLLRVRDPGNGTFKRHSS
jgi:hypothetical protein